MTAPRVAAYSAMRGAGARDVCMILSIALLGLSAAATLQGVWPSFLSQLAGGVVHYSVFRGPALIAIVAGVLCILADRG